MQVVFLGTPEFARIVLEKLEQNFEILAIVCQPDKALGRKQIITPPPTKVFAQAKNIKVYQPSNINEDKALINFLEKSKPDFLVTVAYGQILKPIILNLAPVLNLHASLLPEYKGPAPINWAIIHGETRLGLTSMLSDQGVDTGDILLQDFLDIDDIEDAQMISTKFAIIGADLLIKTLSNFDQIKAQKQNKVQDPNKELAPFLHKNLGLINFAQDKIILKSPNPRQKDFCVSLDNSAKNIHNLVRALKPWPGAYFMYRDRKIIINQSSYEISDKNFEPGLILGVEGDSIKIACQKDILIIHEIKPEGKSSMSAKAWLNGLRLDKDIVTSLLV